MPTQCNQKCLEFHPLHRRRVRGRFDGGAITSDGGGLLLREVEKRTKVMERFAACFGDQREAERIEHTVKELVGQRVYGLALGYEDLNDHDELRQDPLLVRQLTDWRRSPMRWGSIGRASGIAARRWRARARSSGWS